MAKTFIGGVHPPENKEYSEKQPIKPLDAPAIAFVPLSQHAGAPATPIIKKGDSVLLGQTVGEASGFISASVHSPVSGKVLKIDLYPHPVSGRFEPTIFIENNGLDEPANELIPFGENWLDIDPKQIPQIAQKAGLAGMGGAAFPTHVKLSPPAGKEIDTVFLNGAECEPYLTADHRLMLEYPDEILNGLLLIGKTLNAKRLVVCIEKNKPDAIAKMSQHAKGKPIEIIPLKVKYPQGAEKQMIYAITKRQVPSGGLPFDVGCCVQNVGTAKALFDAVHNGIPLYKRVVTVSGPLVRNPSNLMVRIGTPIKALIEACGGCFDEPGKIISGGPMMGLALATDAVPVVKGMSGILLFHKKDAFSRPELPCINCAKCVDACPAFLLPTRIAECVEVGYFDMAEKLGALDCIECGSCAFICPSDRKLLQNIRWAKSEIRARRKRV